MITEMKAGHLKDIDKPSEPFEVIGKIIPRYENENWTFTELLYEAPYLKSYQDEEELVFSHGDLGDSNIFVKDGKVSGFIDLGRSGRADKWYDIAFCVRSIREDIGEEQYVELFFDLLGIKPDWEKIKYYILLDELF
ncbi:TPA: phosphotransferase [Staphylococcus aureus]|nr:phosphotransferase [Staphylococcus aureus]HAR4106076.1 phosphotransferase [Staphylococcus aureus]